MGCRFAAQRTAQPALHGGRTRYRKIKRKRVNRGQACADGIDSTHAPPSTEQYETG